MTTVISGDASADFQTPLPVGEGGTGAATASAAAAAIAPIQLGTSVNTTSGTSVELSTSIPAGVKRVVLSLLGVSTTGTSIPLIQIGSGSFDTSGYTGDCAGILTGSGAIAGPNSSAGFPLYNGASAAAALTGLITLSLNSANIWVVAGTARWASQGVQFNAGSKSLSAALDRIRLTTVGGTDTFDGGSVNISWEF